MESPTMNATMSAVPDYLSVVDVDSCMCHHRAVLVSSS